MLTYCRTFLFLPLLVTACTDQSCIFDEGEAVSFLQSGYTKLAHARKSWRYAPGPWDHHRYVVGTRHKAGSQLLRNLMRRAFDTLGANYSCKEGLTGESIITTEGSQHMEGGELVTNHCPLMPDSDCPIHWNNNLMATDLARNREEKKETGMRAVHIVRDPHQMLASGYCYHHRGEEQGTRLAPPNIMELSAEAGVPQMAETMHEIIYQMVEAYKIAYTNDTYTVFYEKPTRSSEDFDATVVEMFNFLFDGLITPAQMQQIKQEAKYEDLNRGDNGYSGKSHVSGDACKEQALAAVRLIPEPLASNYNRYRQVLGYT